MKKIFLSKSKGKKAFTLVEILVAILILSIIIVTGFELYTKAIASKIKIDEQANLEKNIYYFSEKIFQLVKNGGTLDYEEYWNRNIINQVTTPSDLDELLKEGHFKKQSGFGNFGLGGIIGTNTFGDRFYYCLSNNDLIYNPKDGCVGRNNTSSKDSYGQSKIYISEQQRYGQYSFQFIDYNSNADDDKGDEDEDFNGNIMRDDDDLHLGKGPIVFPENSDIKELYLLSGDKKIRTLIRWNIKQDEFLFGKLPARECNSSLKKSGANYTSVNPTEFAYCRGTIEYLQLEGVDWGLDHKNNTGDEGENDGVIDTWLIAKNFSGKTNIDSTENNSTIAGTLPENEMNNLWKPLFNDSINISDFKVFAYPNIDSSKVWNISEEEQKKFLISPYVVLSFEIRPSWKVKSKISGGEIKPVRFNMTVNLTEVFSK